MTEKEMQRKYMQYQLIQQQLKSLIENKIALEEKKNHITESIEAVKKIKDMKKGSDVWSPVGPGIFISSNIKDTDKFLVGIGADVVVKKNTEDSIKILEDRLMEMEELDSHIVDEINKYGEQMQKTEKDLQKLIEQSQSEE